MNIRIVTSFIMLWIMAVGVKAQEVTTDNIGNDTIE